MTEEATWHYDGEAYYDVLDRDGCLIDSNLGNNHMNSCVLLV